jgi:hypothetical protein
VPVRIDDSAGLDELQDRVHINLTEDATFMDGVDALVDHLRSLGLSAVPDGRCVLPLAFHRAIELDTFILDGILTRWIGQGLASSDIAPETMHLLKSERLNALQRKLRARISTYWSGPRAMAEGLGVLRTIDADVARREWDLRERSALILREFGYGFGLSNSKVIEVVRWYTRAAMHYLMVTLEAAEVSEPETTAEVYEAVRSLPTYQPDPSTAEWWKIDGPVTTVRVHHQDREGRYHTTWSVMLPKTPSDCRRRPSRNTRAWHSGVPSITPRSRASCCRRWCTGLLSGNPGRRPRGIKKTFGSGSIPTERSDNDG